MLGEGQIVRSFTKRSVVEMGNRSIYNVLVPQRLGSYMQAGDDVAVGYAQLLWTKQVFAVASSDGRVHRVGAFRMGIVAFATLIMTLLCLLGALTATPLFWLAVLAFGAWFAQAFNAFHNAMSFGPLGKAAEGPVGA